MSILKIAGNRAGTDPYFATTMVRIRIDEYKKFIIDEVALREYNSFRILRSIMRIERFKFNWLGVMPVHLIEGIHNSKDDNLNSTIQRLLVKKEGSD